MLNLRDLPDLVLGKIFHYKYIHDWVLKQDENEVCKLAAENGYLNCLKYAREIGRRWDTNTCYFAARNGHLDCLKYLHENGCVWDDRVYVFAEINRHRHIIKYARENNCPE